MRLKYWLPTTALVIASASASAQTVSYDGGGNTKTPGPHINTAFGQPPAAAVQQFTLSSATTFDDIRYFWENSLGEAFASVDYSIYSGSAFSPATTFLSGTLAQSYIGAGGNTYFDHAGGGDSYEGFYTDINVGLVTLGPGTYFLQLHSTDSPDPGGTYLPNVYWERATGTSDPASCEQGYAGALGSCGPGGADRITDAPDVFDLLRFNQEETPVTTPEPASIVLFGTGLLGLAGSARRRACRQA